MIRLEGITKSFGGLQVLRGIDLEIEKGRLSALSGLAAPERLPYCRLWVRWICLIKVR